MSTLQESVIFRQELGGWPRYGEMRGHAQGSRAVGQAATPCMGHSRASNRLMMPRKACIRQENGSRKATGQVHTFVFKCCGGRSVCAHVQSSNMCTLDAHVASRVYKQGLYMPCSEVELTQGNSPLLCEKVEFGKASQLPARNPVRRRIAPRGRSTAGKGGSA